MNKFFVFGYGSLINKKSLQSTLPDAKIIAPVLLKSYERSWNATPEVVSFATTFLGLLKRDDKITNGVIFEVTEEMLSDLDKREFIYDRVELDQKDFVFLSSNIIFSNHDKIYTYITKKPIIASQNHPIIQSYIDICLEGCLQIEADFGIENFAQDFILQTNCWSGFWVNDRLFPRAPKRNVPKAYEIDQLLFDNVYKFFKEITIE